MSEPKSRILLVDDEPNQLVTISRILSRQGYRMLTASNGQEALGLLAVEPVDVMVTDLNMPIMDGLTFVKTYRGAGNTTPIIMVTTESEKAKVVAAIKAGVNNYVVKPFTPDTLEARINDTLGKKAA